MTEFKFLDGDLPEDGRRCDPILDQFAQALKARPGQWAEYPLVRATATLYTTASHINSGAQHAPMAFRGGTFQARVSKGVLYVRFAGASA